MVTRQAGWALTSRRKFAPHRYRPANASVNLFLLKVFPGIYAVGAATRVFSPIKSVVCALKQQVKRAVSDLAFCDTRAHG